MDEHNKLQLKREYEKYSNEALIEMEKIGKNGFQEGVYEIILSEIKKRELGEVNKVRENNTIRKKYESKDWGGLLWWKINISDEDLKDQVEQYNILKITQSARGISFLVLIFSCIITLLFIIFSDLKVVAILETIIFFIFGLLIYKGYKGAIITVMLLWTIEKLYLAYESIFVSNNISGVQHVIWWALCMRIFYIALKIEQLRKRSCIKKG